jgi:copper(I)-binding protein
MKTRFALAALLALTAFGAPRITTRDAWVMKPVGKQEMTAGFVTLHNNGADTALVSATCDAIKNLELHEMEETNGRMQMKMVDEIELPKGEDVRLEPGGLHLMMIGFTRPIKEGDVLVVRLRFADGTTSDVKMPVRKREA